MMEYLFYRNFNFLQKKGHNQFSHIFNSVLTTLTILFYFKIIISQEKIGYCCSQLRII